MIIFNPDDLTLTRKGIMNEDKQYMIMDMIIVQENLGCYGTGITPCKFCDPKEIRTGNACCTYSRGIALSEDGRGHKCLNRKGTP